jgi:YVTN family beta-propeller protein
MKTAGRALAAACSGLFVALFLAFPIDASAAVTSPSVVYVTNSASNTVSVVDAATDRVTATIAVGLKPWSVAVSPDGFTAYVSDSGSADVSVIDTRTHKVRATVAVGERPCDLRVSPDGRFVYVDLFVDSAVAVIDTATDHVVRKIPVGGVNPYGMALSASGNTLYTANVDEADNRSSTVSVIDLLTNTVTAVIAGFNASEGVAVSPDGGTAYAASINTNVLSIIDATTRVVTRTANVGAGPQGVMVSPDGFAIYTANSGAGTVSVVDATSFVLTRTVQVGTTPAELAFSPDGRHVYVSNFDSGSITDVDTATGLVLATVKVGAGPHGITVGALVAATSQVGSIAGSLPRPADAFSSTAAVIGSAAVAVGGTFFLTFPAHLFNLTFQENYDALRSWWVALPDRLRRKRKKDAAVAEPKPEPEPKPDAEPRVGKERIRFALVVLAGALFGALLDPRFGPNARTAESYVAIVATVIVGAALPALVVAAYHRSRSGGAAYHLEALPGGLLIAAGCVLVSRLAGFSPGYLYGVVAGVVFSKTLATRQKGHVIALSTMTTLTVAIVAWLAWVPVDRIAEKPGAFAGLVIADDFLGSMFVGGLVGTAIGLLPLRFLPGWALKEWHRGVWAALFAATLFGVVDLLLLRHHGRGGHTSSLVTTLVLFVVFAGGSIAFREYFARKRWHELGVSPHGFRAWLQDLITPAPPAA